jgi:hypothetical protein
MLATLVIFAVSFTGPVLKLARTTVRMSASDSCASVASGPLGQTWACDEPQGLGSEIELINGEEKWVRYPSMPYATIEDVVSDACSLIGTLGANEVWSCKGGRPANGINCEQEFIDGELVWACVI